MKIAADKWKHFYVGIGLGAIGHAAALFYLHLSLFPAFMLALGFVAAVGFGFELFSLITGLGHSDLMDGVATVLGGLPEIALCWLL